MTRAYDPSDAVLKTLRADLRNGVLGPGSPIVVSDVAKTLRVSPTPVREGLARLAGEGLVEEYRGRGFSAPRLDASYLSALHQLHGSYVTAALAWPRRIESMALVSPHDDGAVAEVPRTFGHGRRTFTEQLWRAVITSVDNRVLERHQQRVSDQLAVARLVEMQIFPDLDAELAELAQLSANKASSVFESAVIAYHRRRCDAANRIAHSIRDTFSV